jgi:hypothetical protein
MLPLRLLLTAVVILLAGAGAGAGTRVAHADFGPRRVFFFPRPQHPVGRDPAPFDVVRPIVEQEVGNFFRARDGGLGGGSAAPVADSADDPLMQPLYQRFGDAGLGVVISDQWGHGVQNAAALSAPDPVQHLQRDCFTGAWLATQSLDTSRPLTTPEILNVTEDLFGAFGDAVHGTGAQRRGAVLQGLNSGIASCLDTATLSSL